MNIGITLNLMLLITNVDFLQGHKSYYALSEHRHNTESYVSYKSKNLHQTGKLHTFDQEKLFLNISKFCNTCTCPCIFCKLGI